MHFIRRVLLPCCVFLPLCGCKPKAEPEPILIGHVAPFTGPDKQLGEHARQAIRLAIEEANKQENLIAGRRVAVLHVDPHGDLDALQPEAVRLITVNRVVALFGGLNAAQVERLSHAAQPYEVALITPAAVPTEQMADNVFSVNTSLAFQGQVLARFAHEELKAERVAVLADGQRTASMALAEAFNKEWLSLPGRHAPRQWVYKGEGDLAKAVAESKEVNPQAILFAGAANELANARTALKATGLAVPVLLGEDGEHLAALESGPKPSNDVFLATPYVLPEVQEFAKEYEKHYHESPGIDALLAYDGVQILVQAVRRAKIIGATNAAAKVRAELASADGFDSLTGRLRFNKDHSAWRPLLFVVRFENGKMYEVKRFKQPETQ